MRPEHANVLRELIGKTVVEVRVSDDEDDYGFELVFDDGSVLEVYDIRCMAMSEECMRKRIRVVNFETREIENATPSFVGGGVAWTVAKEGIDESEHKS